MTKSTDKQQGAGISEGLVYNPSDIYIPLTDSNATPEELVNLILERNASVLSIRVLHPEGNRKEKIGNVLKVLARLRKKQAHILNESGIGNLAVHVERSDVLLDAASIASRITGGRDRNLPIYRQLAAEELRMGAEILACLGFLADDMRTMPNDGKFRLLSDEIPPQILGGDVDLTSLPLGEVQTYIAKHHLNEWMKSANADIQECITEAFKYLKKLSAKSAPKGPQGQPFEMMADLGTQSFINLIGMVLNKNLSLLRRFEAIRLLEWAIAFFSIKRNPIYQAQQHVRKEIHDLFKIGVWNADASKDEFGPMRVNGDVYSSALKAENLTGNEDAVLDDPLEWTARYVKSSIRALLGAKREILGTTNAVAFDSRDKTLEASALKLKLKAELVRLCEAVCDGETTAMGINKAKAEKILVDLKRRRRARGLDDATFSVKPVMLDALDDHVGCAVVVNLSKPLETLNRREKSLIGSLFTTLALDLTDRLCLTNVQLPEPLLDKVNPTNGKTSEGFRVYKIHGDYSIEAEVFDGGNRVKRKIMVPVEIQFLPVESYLRSHYMSGETGDAAYAERKAKELAPVILPGHIDGQKVFPIATSAR